MNCDQMKEELLAMEAGQLDEDEAREAQIHLLNCSTCLEEQRIIKETWAVLSVLGPVPSSSDFRVRFWERASAPSLNIWRFGWQALAGFLGIWIAGVSIGFFLFWHSPYGRSALESKIQWHEARASSFLEDVYFRRDRRDRI